MINRQELEQVVGELLDKMPDRGSKSVVKPDGTHCTREDIENNKALDEFLKADYKKWTRILEEDPNKPKLSEFSGFSFADTPTAWVDPVDGTMVYLLGV